MNKLKFRAAVANSGATFSSAKPMGAENHFTNGTNPKSPMSRGNFKIFALVVLVAGMVAVASCKKDDEKVPKNVIELVSSVEVFTEKEEWEREEIVSGTERNWTESSNCHRLSWLV